ncbi:MAG: DUF5320 domain-containing protein [Candidatus Hydrogenedentota bacterium]
MPGGDGTGPMGFGPMTGRAAGYCAGYPVPGYMNPVPARGWGFGFGFGRRFRGGFGWGRRWGGWFGPGRGFRAMYGYGRAQARRFGLYPYGPNLDPYAQVDELKEYASMLEQELIDVKQELNELNKTQEQKPKE